MAYQRNDGYFISVSLLRMVPYDFEGIRRFMEHILPDADLVSADLMKLREGRMTVYSAMMTNNLALRCDVPFSLHMLDEEIVSSIRFRLGGLNMEIKVCFMDDNSYEVSLCALHCEMDMITDGEYAFWEEQVFAFIDCIEPVYGNLGIEANTCSVSEILTDEFFVSTDQLYFCTHLIDMYGETLKKLLRGYTIKRLKHGCYWCMERLGDGCRLPRSIQRQLGSVLAGYITYAYPEHTKGSIISNVFSSL